MLALSLRMWSSFRSFVSLLKKKCWNVNKFNWNCYIQQIFNTRGDSCSSMEATKIVAHLNGHQRALKSHWTLRNHCATVFAVETWKKVFLTFVFWKMKLLHKEKLFDLKPKWSRRINTTVLCLVTPKTKVFFFFFPFDRVLTWRFGRPCLTRCRSLCPWRRRRAGSAP